METRGIEPVPPGARTLGFRDYLVLWGDLGVGLLVLFTGSLLVPALGLPQAVAAILIGSVVGVVLLALAGVPSSVTGVPTMATFRGVLGVQGSYVPTVVNVVQLLGWTIFELVVMGYAANAVSRRVFGWDAYWFWVAVAAVLVIGLGLLGPLGVVRRFLGRFAVWIMLATSAYLTWLLFTRYDIAALWAQPGKGGFPGFWTGVDLVIAMPISWMPLVGDYSRLARRPAPAAWGTALGYLPANIWFYSLGALVVLATRVVQEPKSFVEGIMLLAGPLALLVLLVDETDEAWADLYSCAVSLQNIVPTASERSLILGTGALSFLVALAVDLTQYEPFLLMIGSVFVPLFGVLLADFFVLGRRYEADDLLGAGHGVAPAGAPVVAPKGAPIVAPKGGPVMVRWPPLVAWCVGIAVYHWIAGKLGWAGLAGVPWLGASIPSLLVALSLHVLLAQVGAASSRARALDRRDRLT